MSDDDHKIDARQFRQCMGRFATGVTVVTGELNDEIRGMTANAFLSVSLDPPLVLVSVSHKAHMHSFLQQTMSYGVSILNESQIDLSNHFAGQHQEDLEISFVRHADMPLVEGAVAHIVTTVVDIHEVGDHSLYIGKVIYLNWHDQRPLLFYAGSYSQLKSEAIQAYYYSW